VLCDHVCAGVDNIVILVGGHHVDCIVPAVVAVCEQVTELSQKLLTACSEMLSVQIRMQDETDIQ